MASLFRLSKLLAEGVGERLGETRLRQLLPKLVRQLVDGELRRDDVGRRQRLCNVVVTENHGDVFVNVASVDDVTSGGRDFNLISN